MSYLLPCVRFILLLSILMQHPVWWLARPYPAETFTLQEKTFLGALQSSLYTKASQIDRPLSRSHFKEQSGRLLPSSHTTRYRLVCRIYLLGQNGQIAKTELSAVRSNILLAATSHHRTYHSVYGGSQNTMDSSTGLIFGLCRIHTRHSLSSRQLHRFLLRTDSSKSFLPS
jgi:hypothetical protein